MRQGVQRPGQQPLGDEAVEAADHHAEAHAGGVERAANLVGLKVFSHRSRHRSLISRCLFSGSLSERIYLALKLRRALFQKCPRAFAHILRRAAQTKQRRLERKPSSCGISVPRSIASMVNCTASGAFAAIFRAMASAAGSNSAGS